MNFRKQVKTTTLTFFALLLITISSYAEYTVRTIYFQPTDAPAAPVEKIQNAMEHTQKFYADEMQRHKFGRKTFRLERVAGKVVVHTVRGRHKANHYRNDTAGTLNAELPAFMKSRNDILISFIGGLDGVAGGWNGQGGPRFEHNCGACRGWAAVADKSGNFAESTVAHELGHAFGLYHNLVGKQGADFLMWSSGVLDFYEARLLNKSRYFNTNNHIVRPPPRISNPKRPEMTREDTAKFSANVTAGQGLYQAQLFRDSDLCVIDWTRLSGQSDTAIFEMNRAELIGESRVWIHVQDNDGNQSLIPVDFTLDKPDYETEGTATYLTLSYDSSDALTPTNPQHEWGWNWGGWQQTWEKTPDGKLPPKPHNGFMPDSRIPFTKEWDYWFYAHVRANAPSRIAYDLSNGNYTKFDAYFDMPNPCTHIATPASVEVKILADGAEIYHSGIWKGDEARNTHISVDIPKNTEKLTITVSNAGDGGICDHFIFANARLLSETTTTDPYDYDTSDTEDTYYTDVNTDGVVNIVDLVLVAARYGERITGSPHPNPDVDRNGFVDVNDLILIATAIDKANSTYSAPTSQPLAPTETALLPNYPNPFNPETWIPYQLSEPAAVTITIYAADGRRIRTFALGHQPAGMYHSKNRAVYWDGRNNFGERVASSVYFSTLTAGNFTTTRKMLIRK